MIRIEPLAPEHFGLASEWLSRDDTTQWLTSEWRGRKADPSMLAIVLRNKRNRVYAAIADNRPVGLVGLADLDPADRCAMAWYLLGEKALSSKGVISTAVGQLCRIGFDSLGLTCIYAWIMAPNTASRRVLEKNRFREAGTLRRAAACSGEQVDRVYFDLTPEDLR